MVEVTGSGKKRIQSDDGKVGLNLNDDALNFKDGHLDIAIGGVPRLKSDEAGIKLSQEEEDVTQADNADLVITSRLNAFKIVATGTATVTSNNTDELVVNHNLGFQPGVMCYSGLTSDVGIAFYDLPRTHSLSLTTSGGNITQIYIREILCYSSSANLWFRDILWGNKSSPGSITQVVRYYLLQETSG